MPSSDLVEALLAMTMRVDLSNAGDVEVAIAHHPNGARMWINVDGKCAFRIYDIKNLTIKDNRRKPAALPEQGGDDIDEFLAEIRREVNHWRKADHTVAGPLIARLLNRAADEIEMLRAREPKETRKE